MADERQLYQIRVEGQLDRRWREWFAGMSLTYQLSDGGQAGQISQTILTGYVVDQPALYAMLNKLCELNRPLVAVIRLPGVARTSREATCDHP